MSNFLFVCSRNQWCSPTAEKIFRKNGYSARSAGTSPNAKNTISVADIKWADNIIVMDKKHKNRIITKFTRLVENKEIHILEIPDEYKYMVPELVHLIEVLKEPYV